MDLILLPGVAFEGRELARLNDFVAWLAADAQPVDVYLFAPPDARDDERFFAFLRAVAPVPGFLYVIVPMQRICSTLLHGLAENGVAYVVVDDDGAGDADAAISSIAAYFDEAPGSSLMLGVWVELPGTGSDLARVRAWTDAGIASEVVRGRPFPHAATASSDGAVTIPQQLLGDLFGCALYAETFVLDAAGTIRACPRDAGAVAADLGNLHEAPEELVARRARLSSRAGNFAICQSCAVGARFSWTARRGPLITEVWNAARAAAAHGPSPAVVVSDTAAPADDIDATLRDFEQRLEQWSRAEQVPGRSDG